MIDLSSITIAPEFSEYADLIAKDVLQREDGLYHLSTEDALSNLEHAWAVNAPTTIDALGDGMTIQLYNVSEDSGIKLNVLGFANVDFSLMHKVTIVEYAQTGSMYESGRRYRFGIGARMMLEVRKKGWLNEAKLANPMQMTASVIFGKAEVTYRVATFGIVGPATTHLIKAGALGEDTYQEFLSSIAALINSAYKNNPDVRITPQPLVFQK